MARSVGRRGGYLAAGVALAALILWLLSRERATAAECEDGAGDADDDGVRPEDGSFRARVLEQFERCDCVDASVVRAMFMSPVSVVLIACLA